MKYYIGIDGGGTKTEFVLADENGNALTSLLKEGSNPNDKGIENSYNILLKGIQELLKGKEISPQNIFIFAGISGAAVGNNAKILKTKLSKDYPNVEVESDLMNENLMINVRPSNLKLKNRMVRIVQDILGCDEILAEQLLNESEWDIKKALKQIKE